MVSVGILYRCDGGKDASTLHRVMACQNGHHTEVSNVEETSAWVEAAVENAMYPNLLDSNLVPHDIVTLARRRNGKINILKIDDTITSQAVENLPACPFCAATDLSILKDYVGYYISCDGCDAYGPDGSNFKEAAERWGALRAR